MLIILYRIPYSHNMINIKRICLFVIFAVIITPIYAESKIKSYAFSISPIIGGLYGVSEEIVYKDPNSKRLESELLWDLKPLFYAGLAADFGPTDFFAKHGFSEVSTPKISL